MDAMEQKTERAAFEAWAEKNWMYVDVKDNSWEVWRAAIAAERERCVKVCEAMISRAPTSTSYADYLVITALQDASELIRKV